MSTAIYEKRLRDGRKVVCDLIFHRIKASCDLVQSRHAKVDQM